MSLKVYGDFTITTSTTIRDGVTRDNHICTIDSGPRFRRTNLETLAESYAAVTCLTNPAGISFITAASCVIVSTTAGTIDLIEVATGYRQNYSSGTVSANSVAIGKGQRVAGDPISKIAISMADDTAGKVMKINGNTFTITTHTSISGMTGKLTTVIAHPAGNLWIAGSNDGKIHELNATPTINKTITLPTTPNTGGAPTWLVSGLSYFDDKLLVTTAQGMAFLYNYATDTEIKRFFLGNVSSGGGAALGTPLCDSASGAVLYCPNYNKTTIGSEVLEYDLVSATTEDIHRTETAQKSSPAVGIDPIYYKAWAIIDTNKVRVFDISSRDEVQVDTVTEDPEGTPVSARIIRLRSPKVGLATVETDQNISAVETDLPARENSHYIEITYRDLATDRFDVRVFDS